MIQNNEIKFFSVPLVINITLYRNNYVDNIIIGELRRGTYSIGVPEDPNSFSVSAEEFKNIVIRKFKSEVDKLEDFSKDILPKHINSAYFMYNMLTKFNNLKIVNIHISNNRKYTRVYKVNDQNVIGFDYKIAQGILDFPKFLDLNQLNRFNKLLVKIGMHITSNLSMDPYYIIKAQDFINKLANLENDDKAYFDRYYDIIEVIYELLESKLESDNTFLIIKTDFEY